MHNSYLFDRVTVRGRLGEQAKNKTWLDLASLYYYSKLVFWLSSYSASSVHFNLSSLFSKGQDPTGFLCPSSQKTETEITLHYISFQRPIRSLECRKKSEN